MEPRIGLALSGGGARGLAHIGVLKVLEREGIPISCLAGTSMGGVIAAAYAAGLSVGLIEQEALRMSQRRHWLSLIDRTPARRGLLQGQKVTEYLAQWLGHLTFDQLRLPLALVAVDLNSEQKVVLRSGSVLTAVRATIAVPGVFTPVELDGQMLVDGGLLDNLPADVAREMGADVVVAVDVATDNAGVAYLAEQMRRRRFLPSALADLLDVLYRSLVVTIREANRRSLAESRPDLLVCPPIPPQVSVFSGMSLASEVIASGERAMEEALPALRRLTTGH
jgi:NTE family protein